MDFMARPVAHENLLGYLWRRASVRRAGFSRQAHERVLAVLEADQARLPNCSTRGR